MFPLELCLPYRGAADLITGAYYNVLINTTSALLLDGQLFTTLSAWCWLCSFEWDRPVATYIHLL